MSKPLHFWSLTVGNNHGPLPSPARMDVILAEFFSQWVYQGEYGDKEKKPHYQCRVIIDEKQMKQTLIHCLAMRGIARDDVTFQPESNKSIEQGGLSFYVMDDQKDVWLPVRCDPSYQVPRKSDWIPDMCKHIVEDPRPWFTSVITKLKGPPHHRFIIWICTLAGLGGVGKSLFNCYLHVTGLGKSIGQGTPIQLQERVIAIGEYKGYTLDLPKTMATENKIGDYINSIEIIKNGFIATAMHGKPKELVMNQRPHIVVFSNRLPPYEQMTEGRFDVYTIDPKKDPSHQTLDHYVPDQD